MDMTTIAAAQESIKALSALVRGATSAAIDHGMKAKLIDIQSAILDTQAKLGDAQAERIELLQQVGELQSKLRELEKAKTVLDSYELCSVDQGKFLYKPRQGASGSEVEHYACPACYNAGSLSVLQQFKTGSQQTLYSCHACKFELYVGPSDPPKPLPIRGVTMRNW